MKKLMTIFLAFLKIGAFTFGGGYAMIALLENELIEKKKWIEHDEFLNMVAVAESTPGPIAINSATYIGYHLAGFSGATVATLAVCIPSFLIIYCISLFLERFLSLTYVACAFKGIQVCVIYLILSTGIQMLKTLEKNWMNVCILCAVMGSYADLFRHCCFFFFCFLCPDLWCSWRFYLFSAKGKKGNYR